MAYSKNLLALIAVVFFSTLASVMVVTVLPAFFTQKLHLTYEQIGYIEGVTAFTAFLSKFFSGIFSDKIHKRKDIIVWGTRLSILSKGCFALSTGFLSVFMVQTFDRLAKGMRSCPSDAMIADLSTQQQSGLYYGLKYTAFMMGSVLGGCFTYQLLKVVGSNFKVIFCLAMIPACIAYFISTCCIYENPQPPPLRQSKIPFLKIILGFNSIYWKLLGVLFLLMFARFGTSFLGIHIIKLGMPTTDLPRFSILYDCCAVFASLISGFFSCHFSKERIFKISLIVHAGAHFLFFIASSKIFIVCGAILAGFHIGMAQGTIMSLISKFTSHDNHATAFALYYFIAGFGILLSNILAGELSYLFQSPSGAFLGGIIFCGLTFLAFQGFIKSTRRIENPQT